MVCCSPFRSPPVSNSYTRVGPAWAKALDRKELARTCIDLLRRNAAVPAQSHSSALRQFSMNIHESITSTYVRDAPSFNGGWQPYRASVAVF